MPSRILYVGQEVKIVSVGGGTRYLPVQSTSCSLDRPISDVLSFGHLGSLGRVQNAVSTCKADIKSFVPNLTGVQNYLLNSALIAALTGEALAGTSSVITVSPNGFTMSGILTSLNIDISEGSFATADLSFAGVGEPIFASTPTGVNFSDQGNMPTSFQPITSTNVAGNITGLGCASSFKFSLDLPTESVVCLGGNVSGSQGAVASSFLQVAKPPFKATVSLEGLAVDATAAGSILTNSFNVGKLGITLPAAQISSRSYNNAVGAVGATYNFVLEDVSATFSDLP